MRNESANLALPAALDRIPQSDPEQALTHLLADSLWVDAVSQASLAVGRPIPEARQAFEHMLRTSGADADRAVMLAALARCANSQMRLLEGAGLLRQAWDLLGDEQGDRRIFVQLELGRFLLLTGSLDAARLLISDLPRRATGEYLRRLALYYLLALDAAAGQVSAEPALRDSLAWFREEGHTASVVAHVRMLASLRRASGDEAGARAELETELSRVADVELPFCRALLHNDLAHLHHAAGRLDEALAHLDLSLAEAEFPYARIDALDLKGRFLLDAGRLDEAAALLAEALDLAREAGTLIILPALAHHIGLCQERRGEPALARHFHAQAYTSTMELLEHGLPATAVRIRAIKAHVEAQRRAPLGEPAPAQDPGDESLAFALGHNLKDIRTLLQTALLEQAVARWGSQQESARRLGLAIRTAGNIRRRYRELGQPELPLDLRHLVDLDESHDWKQLNHHLDDRILLWLADRHKGSLRELSTRLEVNYAHLSNLISQARKRTGTQRKDPTP